MKTRIQKAGGDFGSKDGTVWEGDFPLVAVPGVRIVIFDEDENPTAYVLSQIALEINASGDCEQVLYTKGVAPERKALLG